MSAVRGRRACMLLHARAHRPMARRRRAAECAGRGGHLAAGTAARCERAWRAHRASIRFGQRTRKRQKEEEEETHNPMSLTSRSCRAGEPWRRTSRERPPCGVRVCVCKTTPPPKKKNTNNDTNKRKKTSNKQYSQQKQRRGRRGREPSIVDLKIALRVALAVKRPHRRVVGRGLRGGRPQPLALAHVAGDAPALDDRLADRHLGQRDPRLVVPHRCALGGRPERL